MHDHPPAEPVDAFEPADDAERPRDAAPADVVVLVVDERHVAYLRQHLAAIIDERLDRWPHHEHAYRDPFDEFSQIQEFRRWREELARGELVGERDHLADVLGDLLGQLRCSKIRFTGDEEAFEHLLRQVRDD